MSGGLQASIPDTMTVLIHGTFSEYNLWFRPGSLFHNYIKCVFKDDFFELKAANVFTWSAGNTDEDRQSAANCLTEYCESYTRSHGIKHFRLIGHSHGGTVANLATQRGLRLRTLMLLATPVKSKDSIPPVADPYSEDYLPKIENIEGRQFFHFFADTDPVVQMLVHANQSYDGTSVSESEVSGISNLPVPWGLLNHWEPTMAAAWRRHRWDRLVLEGGRDKFGK